MQHSIYTYQWARSGVRCSLVACEECWCVVGRCVIKMQARRATLRPVGLLQNVTAGPPLSEVCCCHHIDRRKLCDG